MLQTGQKQLLINTFCRQFSLISPKLLFILQPGGVRKGTIEEALPEESLIIGKQIQLYPFISFALHHVIIGPILFQRIRYYILMRYVKGDISCGGTP